MMFQFLIGRLGTGDHFYGTDPLDGFQFLIGRLGTLSAPAAEGQGERFNSS